MQDNQIDFSILVNNNPIDEYRHNNKLYVEGRKGSKYKLKVKNNRSSRILVVPSVDGLSVMDGEPASSSSSGYIINGFSTLVIEGWRISEEEVRSFFFTRKSNSYTKKTQQDTNNNGVIGLLVFNEKVSYDFFDPFTVGESNYHSGGWVKYQSSGSWPVGSRETLYSATASALSNSPSLTRNIGTGMGKAKSSKVKTVSFEKANITPSLYEIFYHDRRTLESLGIINKKVRETPRSFPRGFCPQVY